MTAVRGKTSTDSRTSRSRRRPSRAGRTGGRRFGPDRRRVVLALGRPDGSGWPWPPVSCVGRWFASTPMSVVRTAKASGGLCPDRRPARASGPPATATGDTTPLESEILRQQEGWGADIVDPVAVIRPPFFSTLRSSGSTGRARRHAALDLGLRKLRRRSRAAADAIAELIRAQMDDRARGAI